MTPLSQLSHRRSDAFQKKCLHLVQETEMGNGVIVNLYKLMLQTWTPFFDNFLSGGKVVDLMFKTWLTESLEDLF